MVNLLAMAAVLLTLNTEVYSYGQIGIQPGRVLYYLQPVNFTAQTAPNNCTKCFTRAGKKGRRGLRGPVGPIGPPGRINETLMDNLQQQMRGFVEGVEILRNETKALQKENKELIKTLASIQAENIKMKAEIAQIKDQQRCRGVRFEGRCYFVLDHRYSFDGSKTACSNEGATFAPIFSVDVFDAVLGYLRGKLREEGISGLTFRVALTYQPSRGGNIMTTLSGTRVTFDKWFPGYPLTSSSYSTLTTIVWVVKPDTTTTYHGLHNARPTGAYRPVCVVSM